MDVPQLRAAALAVVILSHGIVSIPLQARITETSIHKPDAMTEVDGWMGLVNSLGIPVGRERFEDIVIQVSGTLWTVDKALTAPIKPVLHATGTGQAWALFATPDSRPHTLTVEGRSDGGPWRVLHRRLEDTTFLHYILSYRRIRGVYDGSANNPGRAYRNLARLISERALDTYPDLIEVRVRQPEKHTTLPGRPSDPKIVEQATCLFKRGDAGAEQVKCDKPAKDKEKDKDKDKDKPTPDEPEQEATEAPDAPEPESARKRVRR
jgi:hypothetical protein